MRVYVNGQPTEVDGSKTVQELIEWLKLPPRTVLVEHNGLALHRHEWPQRPVAEGDRLELLRVVAGG